jgi:hypothetical protein
MESGSWDRSGCGTKAARYPWAGPSCPTSLRPRRQTRRLPSLRPRQQESWFGVMLVSMRGSGDLRGTKALPPYGKLTKSRSAPSSGRCPGWACPTRAAEGSGLPRLGTTPSGGPARAAGGHGPTLVRPEATPSGFRGQGGYLTHQKCPRKRARASSGNVRERVVPSAKWNGPTWCRTGGRSGSVARGLPGDRRRYGPHGSSDGA